MLVETLGAHALRVIEGNVPATVTIILFLIVNRRAAKKEQDQRHADNQHKLDSLLTKSEYLPPHAHHDSGEKGPLLIENVWYGPSQEPR